MKQSDYLWLGGAFAAIIYYALLFTGNIDLPLIPTLIIIAGLIITGLARMIVFDNGEGIGSMEADNPIGCVLGLIVYGLLWPLAEIVRSVWKLTVGASNKRQDS